MRRGRTVCFDQYVGPDAKTPINKEAVPIVANEGISSGDITMQYLTFVVWPSLKI
jgi:hypothetical protein